jgi:hypothetical protein
MENIIRAMNIYRTQGTGRHMTEQEYKIFQENTLNQCYRYQKICHDTEKRKSLIIGECMVCGNQQHSALKSHLLENGKIAIHYNCPVVKNETWKGPCQLGNSPDKYAICPEKFAKEYQYSIAEIHAALDTFRSSSASERWSTHEIGRLEIEVLQICDHHHISARLAEQENENPGKFRNNIFTKSNLFQSGFHNLIKQVKSKSIQAAIHKLIDLEDQDLIWSLCHNFIILLISILIIVLINTTLTSTGSL